MCGVAGPAAPRLRALGRQLRTGACSATGIRRHWLSATRPASRTCSSVAPTSAGAGSNGADVTLYTARSAFPAFNGWKLTILLEEMVLAGALRSFAVKELNLDALEHKEEWYLKINPNGRIPALVDHRHGDFAVFESGAMMLYLAETYDAFMPSDVAGRYSVIQWLCFQISGVGPMQGQAHAFLRYVPETQPYALSRYQTETRRLYEVLDRRLAEVSYVAGDSLSIADFALYPWVAYHQWAGVRLDGLDHVSRWLAELSEREGVRRGLEYNEKRIGDLLAEAEAIRETVGATTLDKALAKPTGS
jgi:GSH-dependent disulfide-bond oxidoreductase|eukprot:COSAG03_NODE_15_length_22165_cov_72.809934_6_plen_304_part_00